MPQSELIQRVQTAIEEQGLLPTGEPVIVGVSGGPDSLCLLHLLRQIAPAYDATLHVGHLNHGIRPSAAAEAAHVAQRCRQWHLACTIETVDVPAHAAAHGLSLEEAARQARYAFLGRLAHQLGSHTIAVGHNADDQVETVLMHLLRGSGLAGLRGMRPRTPLDELRLGLEPEVAARVQRGVTLVRPLLEVTRAEIEAYCQEHGIEPLYDASNLDTTLFRNRIRHELLPTLASYNPRIRTVLRRMAEALTGDYDVLRGLLAETWPAVVRHETGEHIMMDLSALRELPVGLQRSVLREGVQRLRQSLRDISYEHVEAALEILMRGQTGDQATLPGGLMLTLGYEAVLLAPKGVGWPREDRPRVHEPLPVHLPGTTPLDERWQLRAASLPRSALPPDWDANPDPYTGYFDADRLQGDLLLRPREPSDALYPLGLGHRQSVKELLINAKAPRHERDSLPILVCEDEVVWVVGVRIDARYAVSEQTRQVYKLRFLREGEDTA